MATPLWQKPDSKVDARIMRFLAGDDVLLDREFFLYDITASKAHVEGLANIGVLNDGEACAPVNEPFLWPKNSLSINSEGIAPQLTGTNGPAARGPSSWMERATSSLPVPDSPLM